MQSISLYDILSKVIPGSMTFFLFGIYRFTAHEKIGDVMALFIVYLIGYLIDTISGILEKVVLYPSFGGIPSKRLLEGKSFSSIKVYDLAVLQEYLRNNYPELYPDMQVCFSKLYSIVNKTELPRVKSFLEAYIFSRNICFAFVISVPFFLFYQFTYLNLIVALSMAFLFWYNAKSRAYYFSNEVINSFIVDKIEL